MTTTKARPAASTADDDIEAFITSIDPDTMRDGAELREVSAAKNHAASAVAEVQAAVDRARSKGHSWTMIGIALGTSRQNAHRKYARPGDTG